MEEGFDNPAQGHNPYTNEEKPAGAPTSPPKQHSRTIENADVETSNLSQTLHVLAHRPAEAKAAQANKAEASKRREEEMEDKPWKQLKPNENWGYSPCDHAGRTCEEAAKTDDCLCHGNRTWCDKFCHCPLDCEPFFASVISNSRFVSQALDDSLVVTMNAIPKVASAYVTIFCQLSSLMSV